MNVTLYSQAQRYVGVRELAGPHDHPLIRWWLSLCFDGQLELHDEVPWCSAFLNGMAWELGLARSKSALARTWLQVGTPVPLERARLGYDVVVLWRGDKASPAGHVGLYAGRDDGVLLLGGNQSNAVSLATFPVDRVLGVRRLLEE